MRREADSRRNKPYITAQLLSDESEVAKSNILFTISSRNSVQHKKSITQMIYVFCLDTWQATSFLSLILLDSGFESLYINVNNNNKY